MNLKKLIEKLKNYSFKSQITNVVIVMLVGILILIAASAFKDENTPNISSNVTKANTIAVDDNTTSSSDLDYEENQENKLKEILENIQGIGQVDVMIYYEKGQEQVPAYNKSDSTSLTNETDNSGGKRSTTQNTTGSNVVITTNGDKTEPLIVDKYNPKVSGILITAEGAENDDVKLNVTYAVAEFFNIPIDKVSVFPMKK